MTTTTPATGEKRAVYGLYHRCLERDSGRLAIGQDDYWLLSYEVRIRELTYATCGSRWHFPSGGLVVFEGKLADNSYPPLSAVLEGLDYLACLTSEPNFLRLQEDFWELVEKK